MKTLHYITLAIVVLASLLPGCRPADVSVTPVVDNKTSDETTPFRASFNCLANHAAEKGDVKWDVALTLAVISDYVYEDEPTIESKLTNLGATLVTPIFDTSNECVIASDEKSVVVAFRGTDDMASVLTDIKFLASRRTDERQHAGFYGGVDDIYPKLLAELKRHGIRSKKLWVTGHSLGGALAIVFARRVASDDNIKAHKV